MAEFLTSRKWSELAGKTAKGIGQLPCLEITDEEGNMLGEFGTFLMIPRNDYIQAQMDARGQVSNAFYVAPEEPENEFICPDCGKSCASKFGLQAHQRSHNKVAVA